MGIEDFSNYEETGPNDKIKIDADPNEGTVRPEDVYVYRAPEMKNYKGFFKALYNHFGIEESMELDGGEFEDLAIEHGLIRCVRYDPEKHGEMDAEKGDRIWVVIE